MRGRRRESGQVLVIVAVWMLALIGSAALILLAGSVGWQRAQLQQLADQAALDAALKIGVGCTAGSASTVITEADNFVATQRTRSGSLAISGASCTAPYTGVDTFTGSLSETVHYPYRAHQQQVEVILTTTLPISFGNYLGATSTTVTARAVAQQLSGSTAAVSATTLSCTGGQVNVAGSIKASNTISLSGNCAVYAHARFDAASSTYSDLGNVSVHGGGQTWVGGGGKCTAGSTSGSSNAVCADGFELSGNTGTTCGAGGASAFLLAGDAAVNPNPCAAGTGPLPVAPLNAGSPPEPNTDPAAIATLQGNGGAACTSSGVYPNIQVGGTTVATGLGPVPAKDAGGYYHFKPSCYGYINARALSAGGAISNVQIGPEVNVGSGNVTATLPAGSTAGDLLVVSLVGGNNVSPFAGPAGWTRAAAVGENGNGESEIWYMANAPAGVTSATFTSGSSNSIAQMSEWRGAATVSPLDQTGSFATGNNSRSSTVSTSAADTTAGDLGITTTTWTGGTISSGAGWSTLYHDNGIAAASDYRLGLPAAVASERFSSTQSTIWADVIATFKPGTGAAGAVLDPGFYYFNGSGFAGGGGICLNGSTMLAQGVTLEFVNQAGFSTGTCAAGGGGGCASGSCQFGSTPCSVSACPPNTLADTAGGGYSWFAAPCSSAPTGDASCPGSAWCTAGDRACTNLLIWQAASATGQIAITGSAARDWLLGSVFWHGTCTYAANGASLLDGTIACGSLALSAAAGAGTAIGSDYGINTAIVEAVLIE